MVHNNCLQLMLHNGMYTIKKGGMPSSKTHQTKGKGYRWVAY